MQQSDAQRFLISVSTRNQYFRSLLAFKGKFHPRYQTLYMTYPDSAALPGIAQALTRADIPALTFGVALQLLGLIIRRQNHR